MKPPDIIEVILKVTKIFEKLNIPYYVGGSLASSAFGVARATMDVDIVADIESEKVSTLEEILKKEFYIDAKMIEDAIRQQSSFNLIHLDTMFKIDIFVLKNRVFDKQSFSRRIKKQVLEDASRQLFFATPEDVILNKLEWYKMSGKVSERQWTDVLGILKVQGTKLDISYLKRWSKKLGIFDLLERAFDEAGIF